MYMYTLFSVIWRYYDHDVYFQEVQTFRGQLGMLYSYDWISVPLVYTQVSIIIKAVKLII